MRSWWQDRVWRLKFSGVVSGLAAVAFITNIVVVQIWEHLAPTLPVPSEGSIFRHSDHGSITYFTAFQATSAALMFWTGFIGLALAFITIPKKDFVVRRIGGIPLASRWQNDDDNGIARAWGIKGALVAIPVVWILGPAFVALLNRYGIVFSI
jgi:hypothetical protein